MKSFRNLKLFILANNFNYMLNILSKLITLAMFLLAAGCFYMAVTVTFSTSFVNVAMFIVAIFFLLQGCGRLDKAYGYGKYSNQDNNPPEDKQDKT